MSEAQPHWDITVLAYRWADQLRTGQILSIHVAPAERREDWPRDSSGDGVVTFAWPRNWQCSCEPDEPCTHIKVARREVQGAKTHLWPYLPDMEKQKKDEGSLRWRRAGLNMIYEWGSFREHYSLLDGSLTGCADEGLMPKHIIPMMAFRHRLEMQAVREELGAKQCRYCSAYVLWIPTENGKEMPIKLEHYDPEMKLFDFQRDKEKTHWVDCPGRDEARKRKK